MEREYQPPAFDFEGYGALKQKVATLEKANAQHEEAVKRLDQAIRLVKIVFAAAVVELAAFSALLCWQFSNLKALLSPPFCG